MIEFPKDFLWGAATSAYQVEGENSNSDWWEWEKRGRGKEPSGQACRHYELYKEDFDLAKSLNHNTHRLSVEWSRIEPQEGVFSDKELAHYQQVLTALRERNLKPLVTLHHFTNPVWFSRIGGWENKRSIDYFLRYTKRVVEALGNQVEYWMTINEPLVYAYHAYILGVWPPEKKSVFAARRVSRNLARSHIASYRLIHRFYKDKGYPAPKVSIAKNMQAFVACQDTLRNRLAVGLRDRGFNFDFLNCLARNRSLDYIGVNYYSRNLVEALNWGVRSLCVDTCQKNHRPLKKNSLGWDIYPEGLYQLLVKLKRYNLPIIVSENGICTEDDELRWEYISSHLLAIHRAMQEGSQVKGYLYWSLLDNYEWDKGFTPRFGLVEVDYNSFTRRTRESARKFAQVCKSARLDNGIH
ncbi:MAG: glycoside hydrolase family 1 protein [Candidatus Omnitrophica bacterium]|nr:glycoside hydrolase family 1 protein [Candidatus Omnitrophota bacterium]